MRQVLDYVARGEVDAGFVYRTDAEQMKDKVDIAMIVEGHDPVTYPIAVAITGNNPKAGQEFLNFVLFAGRPGSTGQIRILKAVAHGFFLSLALWKSLF